MRKSLATLLTALILFSCGWTPACIAEPTETDAVWEQVSEAYIYAFPLVLTNATKTMSTNTDGSVTGRARQPDQPCQEAGGRLLPHRRHAECGYPLFAGVA